VTADTSTYVSGFQGSKLGAIGRQRLDHGDNLCIRCSISRENDRTYARWVWLSEGRFTGALTVLAMCSVTYTRKSLTVNKGLSIFVHAVPGTYTVHGKLADTHSFLLEARRCRKAGGVRE